MSPKVTEGGSDGAANGLAEEYAERLPPSALPGISPSRGEIGCGAVSVQSHRAAQFAPRRKMVFICGTSNSFAWWPSEE
ncbi:Hypothetical protein NGAL_HAMBI490_06440 [Neorhizobium galegae bv. officinalis]|nr:Hypothetical protein NGAL_HAMBI490_06440 [Neorhizobium galegae bv. officinalis]